MSLHMFAVNYRIKNKTERDFYYDDDTNEIVYVGEPVPVVGRVIFRAQDSKPFKSKGDIFETMKSIEMLPARVTIESILTGRHYEVLEDDIEEAE